MQLLRDRGSDFEAAGVRRFAISRDSPWTHIAWMQAIDLDFPLLSDWNGEATAGFGIGREFNGFREVPARAAFLVNRDGTVLGAWRYGDDDVPDFDALLDAARSL